MGHIRIRALVLVLGVSALAACETPQVLGKQLNEACSATTPCASGLECSAARGNTCQFPADALPDGLCTANDTKCDGANLLKCAEDGKSWSVTSLCTGSCRDGACVDQICTPGVLSCELDAIVRCAPDGLSRISEEICALGCDGGTSGTTPTCRAQICKPGDGRCVDGTNKIEVCNAAGAAWVSADCDAEGSATCVALGVGGEQRAACVRNVCEPLRTRCDGIAVLRCNAQGSGEEVLQTCDFGCNDDGSCKATTLCVPGAISCSADGTVLQRCNALGTYQSSERCDLNGAGRCVASATSTGALVPRCVQTVCSPASTQCSGDQVLLCADDGSGYLPTERCAFGCAAGACKPAVCTTGARRCTGASGDVLETCADDGRSYVFEQFCGSGCVADASATGGARCAPQVCSPFFARCAAGTNAVERCSSDGRSFSAPQACPAGSTCDNGTCIVRDPTCTVGAQRCNGADIEVCSAPTSGDNFYAKTGSCLGACAGQGCDAAGECGPMSLSLVGVRAGTEYRGDGLSTFLVLSEPLVGPSGSALPDGSLVTVSAETGGSGVSTPARIESGDQDPAAPGLQVTVVDGRIDFVVRAPTLADDFNGTTPVTVRAQLGLKSVCSGSLALNFKRVLDAANPNADVTYASEDFSTFRNRELSSSTAAWNTKNGTLTISPFDAGDGRDGDLIVPVSAGAGNPFNLSTYSARSRAYGDATYARIAEFGPAGDTVVLVNGSSLDPFEDVGTRLLIINQQGGRAYDAAGSIIPGTDRVASVGAWEVVTVAGVRQGSIVLTAPVSRTFGQGGNAASNLADQAVYAYRLPQYNRVAIDGVLTANAWGGVDSGGGILAFYARSADQGNSRNYVSATGRITMDGRGFRGASSGTQPAVPSLCSPVGSFTPTTPAAPSNTLAPTTTPNVCGNFAAHDVGTQAGHRRTVNPDGSGGALVDPVVNGPYTPSGGGAGTSTSTGFAASTPVTLDANRQGAASDGTWRAYSNTIGNPTYNAPPAVGGNLLGFTGPVNSYDSRVGEGPDGRLNELSRIAGYGSTPGGACCKRDFLEPGLPNGRPTGNGTPPSGPLANVDIYLGAAAAHGTMPVAASTCDEAAETVRTYGDPLLYDMFMGAGTGTVIRSSFSPCHTIRRCRAMTGGGCCRTYWQSLTAPQPGYGRAGFPQYGTGICYADNQGVYGASFMGGTYSCSQASSNGVFVADWRCEPNVTHEYCDGRASIKSQALDGKNGGGVVWITAAYLDLSLANAGAVSAKGTDNTFTNLNGSIASTPANIQAGAAGGSIFIRSDRLANRTGAGGVGVITAAGGAGGGDGRVRLDVGGFAATYSTNFSVPAAATAGTGSAEVGSRIVVDVSLRVDSRRFFETNVTVLNFGSALPLTTGGRVDVAAAYQTSGLAVAVSGNGGLNRTNVTPPDDATLGVMGQQVRWYLSPRSSNAAGVTRGMVVAVKQEPL